jgi:short-subunit dehydrogenase
LIIVGCYICSNSYKVKGAWALVTGSTGGIGEALADELASRGFNIMLLSRSAEKLRQTADRIIRTHTIPFVKAPLSPLQSNG